MFSHVTLLGHIEIPQCTILFPNVANIISGSEVYVCNKLLKNERIMTSYTMQMEIKVHEAALRNTFDDTGL